MSAASAETSTPRLPGTENKQDFVGTDQAGIPIAASAAKIWAGSMVGLNSSGRAVTATASTALTIIGIANETRDNSSGGDAALSIPVRGGTWRLANSASTDAIANADLGNECYVVDNLTVAKTNNNGARPVAGIVRGVDSSGVWVEFLPAGRSVDTINEIPQEVSAFRTVRGVVTANVADLTAFTVAGNDGLTYVEGDRVLLINQTTGSQNGIYVVGAVATGTAPLTLAPDWQTGQVQGGMTIQARAGTIFANVGVRLTNAGQITVGTTTPTFAPVRQTLSVTLVAGTKDTTAGVWITANSRIQATRTAVSGVPGPCVIVASKTNGLPGTGAFTLTAGTLADPVVATATDAGSFDVTITN